MRAASCVLPAKASPADAAPALGLKGRDWPTFLMVVVIIACLVAMAESADSRKKSAAPNDSSPPLVICAVPDAMPHTGKADDGSPLGLDVAVVRLVANELGRRLEFHWCASAACAWNCVREKRCDLVIGQPHGAGPAREISWSIPYSGSRFGLVVHRDTPTIRSHSDLNGKRVGIVTGSVALSARGHTAVPFKTREELLDRFVDSRLDAAFVDDDFAAWHLHNHPQLPLERVAEYVPRERWNYAMAVRNSDSALLKSVNRALTNAVANGQVSKAFSDQGVAYRAPFSESEKKPVVADSWKRIRETGELVVSMDPANLPYSAARGDRPGCDVELAQALARKLNLKLKIDWIDIQRKTALGQLLDGECDLAFGAAIEPGAMDDEEEIADRVTYSLPYYGSGYVLVTRKNGPSTKSLGELKGEKSRRIGTEAGSVADYQLRQRGFLRRLFRTQLSVLKSLHDGGIDYAYLWANVGWTLHTSPELDVEIASGYVPEDHWNMAVAMRQGDEELKQQVDQALLELIQDEVVSRTLASYHVPYFPAFHAADQTAPEEETKRSTSGLAPGSNERGVNDDGVIRHEPINRGTEPQMHRRQKSKDAYAGLQRIRGAGVLVVGLDHNSLPFSAVHPKPAGLDYEIAGLLAEKLQVSLKVYWAYSSHDSYPSKLATRELCDVMLGVMPDDRFGKRVTFSKPYYFVDYRFVVPASAGAPPEQTPFAIERGVALRGIKDRPTLEFASLESILEAVVNGKIQAGYVTAARGQWLAEERWPGKLNFIPDGRESVDRFPICAAVRKSDGDLGAAIDQALVELAQSGKLAIVFKRWHVPYESPLEPAVSSPGATSP